MIILETRLLIALHHFLLQIRQDVNIWHKGQLQNHRIMSYKLQNYNFNLTISYRSMSSLERSIIALLLKQKFLQQIMLRPWKHEKQFRKCHWAQCQEESLSLCVALVKGHLRKLKSKTKHLLNVQDLKLWLKRLSTTGRSQMN